MKLVANDLPRRGSGIYVTVDGVLVHNCIEVDTDTGTAVIVQTDDGGRLVKDGDHIATYELRGRIGIHDRNPLDA